MDKKRLRIKGIVLLSYAVFVILLLMQHWNMTVIGDDLVYLERAKQGILYSSIEHYRVWSSRIFIEWMMMVLLNAGFWIWKVADVAIGVIMAYSLLEVAGNGEKTIRDHWMAIMLVLCIQPLLLEGATGYCATSNNYYWTLSLAIYAMIPIKKILKDEKKKFSLLEIICYSVAFLYAANLEQMIVIFAMVMGCITIFYWRKREIPWMVKLYDILLVLESLFIVLCPGNANRYAVEVGMWFPEYPSLDLWQKISMGMGNTLYQVLYNTLPLCMILCLAFIIYCQKNQGGGYKHNSYNGVGFSAIQG